MNEPNPQHDRLFFGLIFCAVGVICLTPRTIMSALAETSKTEQPFDIPDWAIFPMAVAGFVWIYLGVKLIAGWWARR